MSGVLNTPHLPFSISSTRTLIRYAAILDVIRLNPPQDFGMRADSGLLSSSAQVDACVSELSRLNDLIVPLARLACIKDVCSMLSRTMVSDKKVPFADYMEPAYILSLIKCMYARIGDCLRRVCLQMQYRQMI